MNEFQRLQLLHSLQEDTTISETRKSLNEIVKVFKNQPRYEEFINIFASKEWRDLDPQILKDVDAFMVDEGETPLILPEELRHEALGFVQNGYLVYEGRFVYPIKDTHGDVMGFVGYDNEVSPKYKDSKTFGYKAKSTMPAGMEQMRDIYNKDDIVVFTEGIVCALWLRQMGVNALAMLGVYTSEYVYRLMRRLGNRTIVVYDRDAAGSESVEKLKRRDRSIRVVQPTLAKDIDDMRRLDGIDKQAIIEELRRIRTNPYFSRKFFK